MRSQQSAVKVKGQGEGQTPDSDTFLHYLCTGNPSVL